MNDPIKNEYFWDSPYKEGHSFVIPKILSLLKEFNVSKESRMMDIGCGGGFLLSKLKEAGWRDVWGFDSSVSAIKVASESYPEIKDRVCCNDAYNMNLPPSFPSKYDLIISSEVIEHMYLINPFLSNVHKWLSDDGIFLLTTPYHGYLKNLLISLFNKWDFHHTTNWEGGHLRFFSKKTMSKSLIDNNLYPVKFTGAGRIPGLYKSMIVVSRKRGF